ncbi:MAG: hypothetical protein K0R82_336, partial [Flavipsychrobacter sp.]|nr:hypothetical protein [Flavipsychrobacter sp.]
MMIKYITSDGVNLELALVLDIGRPDKAGHVNDLDLLPYKFNDPAFFVRSKQPDRRF